LRKSFDCFDTLIENFMLLKQDDCIVLSFGIHLDDRFD
jgi:hypothetical protein